MPISTRSRRNVQANPVTKPSSVVGSVKKTPAKSVVKFGPSGTGGKPTRGRPRGTKAVANPVDDSAKNSSKGSTVQCVTEVSKSKNPRDLEGFRSETKQNPKENRKIAVPKRVPKGESQNLKLELKVIGDFFKDALSKRHEFYNMFKEAQDDFDRDFEMYKELSKQKGSSSQMPLSHTPLGKQVYANLHATSALRKNCKTSKFGNALISEATDSKSPKILDLQNEAFGQKDSPTNAVPSQELNCSNVEEGSPASCHLKQSTSEIEKNNRKRSGSLINGRLATETDDALKQENTDEKCRTKDDGIVAQSIDKLTLRPVVLLSKMDKEEMKPSKRKRSPEQSGSLKRVIDKIPPSFEFEVRSPGRKKLIMENDVHNPRQEKLPVVPVTNVTYVHVQDTVAQMDQGNVSEELFGEDDLSLFERDSMKAKLGQSSPQILPESKARMDSDSTSSSVSALVERFELKKLNKNLQNLVPATTASKINGPASCNQDAEKEPATQSTIANATYLFEESIVESPMDKKLPYSREKVVEVKQDSTPQKKTELPKEVFAKADATFTKVVAFKMVSNDHTFVVNPQNKLSLINDEESDSEIEVVPPSPLANKTYVKVNVEKTNVVKTLPSGLVKDNVLPPKALVPPASSTSSKNSKSGSSSLSSSSSGSMKSALSQPSLSSVAKMGLKNTALSGSAGTVYEKQKSVANEKESNIKKRLIEKEEEAAKRKLEIDQRKMELQKKKNEEWKRKAEKMKADEKKLVPMHASKVAFVGPGIQLTSTTKGPTVNFNTPVNNPKFAKPLNILKAPTGVLNFGSKFNTNKLMVPPSDLMPKSKEAGHDDSYRTANEGCSFLDVTDMDPANNYDITSYEDIDEECKHRENKSIPDWARGENITNSLFKQIPFENKQLSFFPPGDAKYKLFPNVEK